MAHEAARKTDDECKRTLVGGMAYHRAIGGEKQRHGNGEHAKAATRIEIARGEARAGS